MPRDRSGQSTSSSFAQAAALHLPLSSHGAHVAPSIGKGKACLLCRSRKIRCDGAVPSCGACTRSAKAKGERPEDVLCDYDEPERKKRPAGGAKMAALEAKIAALELRIAELTTDEHSSSQSRASVDPFTPDNGFFSPPEALPSDIVILPTRPYETQRHDYSSSQLYPIRPSAPSHSQSPSLLDILYPGWPRGLPSPFLLQHLVLVFFSNPRPFVSSILDAPRFLVSLQLPPSHPSFPITPLLHAIIAEASLMVSLDVWAPEVQFWADGQSPSDWHREQAKLGLEAVWLPDDAIPRHVQVAQTAIILCFLGYRGYRYKESWLVSAQAIRLVVPIGLNHLRSPGADNSHQDELRDYLLDPTSDSELLRERSATFWMAYTADCYASALTGWAGSIQEEDITTLLPGPPGFVYPTEDLNESPLSIHHPDFLTWHPPHLVQAPQLTLKAVVLLGRVENWLQRSRCRIGVGRNNGPRRQTPEGYGDPRHLAGFLELDQSISAFQASIPREFATEVPISAEPHLALVHALPYTSILLLHHPFLTKEIGDPALQKCLAAAREILKAVLVFHTSSCNITLFVPLLVFSWQLAGVAFVSEIALGQLHGTDTSQSHTDAISIADALLASGHLLGVTASVTLRACLDQPSVCLPRSAFPGRPADNRPQELAVAPRLTELIKVPEGASGNLLAGPADEGSFHRESGEFSALDLGALWDATVGRME